MNVTLKAGFAEWKRAIFIALITSGAFIATASPQLISQPHPGFGPPAGGGGDSGSAIISEDGRFVLFASTADNLVVTSNTVPVSGLLPRSLDVFLRDRTNGTTTLVSVNLTGAGGNGDSLPAGLSTDARYVLFESLASDLVAGDINSGISNNVKDVFVRDLVAGVTDLISINTNGGSGNGISHSPVMTPDGRRVAFVSAATDLVADDTNGIPDIFMRDRLAGTTVLVSAGARAVGFSSSSDLPEITPDGHYVAFYSTATNMVGGVTTTGEIYVRDLIAGTTAWASTNARAIAFSTLGTSNVASYYPRISTNGQYVAFEAISSLNTMVLRHNFQNGVTDVIHTNGAPFVTGSAMTPDGRFVAFIATVGSVAGANAAIYLWDAQTGTNTAVSLNVSNALPANTLCDWPTVDSSGRYVAFICNGANMTTNAVLGEFNLYVRDLQTGVTRLVSVDTNGAATGVYPGTSPAMSADVRFVAFDCPDGNIVANDHNHADDVFVRDLLTDTTELISVHHLDLPSVTPNGIGWLSSFSVSTNGRYVAFASDADNLVPNDTNGYRDVFVRDLLLGTNILVSVATNGALGAGHSFESEISGDGRYVAFTSWVTNLVGDDTNKTTDVFVRDLQMSTTVLVSVSTNGVNPGNAASSGPKISADGRYVLFLSDANNLIANTSFGGLNLFLRNLQSGTTDALTTGGVLSAAMTPDGRYVAFAGYVQGLFRTYVLDVQSATRIYTNNTSGVSLLAISANGKRIAYAAASSLYAADVKANISQVISPLGFGSPNSGFSGDGRFLVYANSSIGIDVYLYDFQLGTNRLINRSYNSPGPSIGMSGYPNITIDGRFIVYRIFPGNSLPMDFNDVPNLCVYDRVSDATILVSASRSGKFAANNRSSANTVFSGDGKTIVFHSWASDLIAQDFNNGGDLFALSLGSPPVTDSDNDGMDDQWENDHFETLNLDGTGDYDNDGASDSSEFQTGSDPTDPTSSFRTEVTGPTIPGWGPTIAWPSVAGKAYRVQFKNNLDDPVWQNLNGNVVIVGDKGYIIDLAPDANQRFYRVVLVTDADGDGMGDQWEETHFETLDRDGTGDFDGDGVTDLFEFQTGTIPTDAASLFRAVINHSATPGQGPEISWPVAPSKSYQVQYKDNLEDELWNDLNGDVTVVGNTGHITDISPAESQRFYRILLIQ